MYTVKTQVLDENGVEVFSSSTPAEESALLEDGAGTPGLKSVAAVLLAATSA